MTEHHTHSKSATDRLDDVVLCLTQNQSTLANAQTELSLKIDSILEHLGSLQFLPHHTPPPSLLPHNHHRPHLKLEVPHFDGHDAMGWIFKIS